MTTRNRLQAFGFLFLVSILFWWHPLLATLGLALGDDAYTHILLILPLSASLIYLDRDALRSVRHGNIVAGLPVLVGAAVLGSVARWGHHVLSPDGQLSLALFALVTWWIGSVFLCFGLDAFRSLFLPLCFLFLLVPLPGFVLNEIVYFLQQQSAFAARIFFLATGVPVTQNGIMLAIPGLDIEVAHECSSIRSSMMLVIVSVFLAHLFLRPWWRKALLIAASLPLSIAKNGLRIFTIAVLSTRVDPGFLNGRLHHHGGIVFFGISVVALTALLILLRRTEPRTPLEFSKAI